MGTQMTVYELDKLGEPRNGPVQQELQGITGVLTVPQIFIAGKYFGNASDVDGMVGQGSLKERLLAAGAECAEASR